MTKSSSVTFRDEAAKRIANLLLDENDACDKSQELLLFLAGALLTFREEGVEFSPTVVLCDSITKLLRSFPGGLSHEIGSTSLDANAGRRILKDCGPLSGENWFVYVERSQNAQARYGVFTYLRSPTAIQLKDAIELNPDQFCVLAHRLSANVVEIRGSRANALTIVFSTTEEQSDSEAPVALFSEACCADLNEDSEQSFRTYLKRVLQNTLNDSHGTILVCTVKDIGSLPTMKDGVHIKPSVDFFQAFSDYKSQQKAESVLSLQRCEQLLVGFARCDGIVVFDTKGCAKAYRVFYRPDKSSEASKQVVVGGARRRAYEELKSLVGTDLSSVLFRSQDGLTLHHGDAK